ncbi:DNA-directed RNA polymerase II core subunit [Pseudocyphellaria aurata]|nr:DNA-directed RNA polymerase II core subunit [Pseudocyphellaria aurata]
MPLNTAQANLIAQYIHGRGAMPLRMPKMPPDLTKATVTSHYAHMTRASPKAIESATNSIADFVGRRREHGKSNAESNLVDRFELFILDANEKKVTEEADTRIPSSSIFTFNKEDHTLGNVIRSRLLQYPFVLFAAYKVPHPLEAKFILRVQTDGTITPRAAVIQSCRDLVHDYALLNQEFTKEWELRKMVGDASSGPANTNPPAGEAAGAAAE